MVSNEVCCKPLNKTNCTHQNCRLPASHQIATILKNLKKIIHGRSLWPPNLFNQNTRASTNIWLHIWPVSNQSPVVPKQLQKPRSTSILDLGPANDWKQFSFISECWKHHQYHQLSKRYAWNAIWICHMMSKCNFIHGAMLQCIFSTLTLLLLLFNCTLWQVGDHQW